MPHDTSANIQRDHTTKELVAALTTIYDRVNSMKDVDAIAARVDILDEYSQQKNVKNIYLT